MKRATRRSSIGIKDGCDSARNFSTRFSLQSFVRRVDKLTDNQKNAINRMGFGDLLQIRYQMLSKNLLVELMDRWICEKRAFLLVHGDIALTPMDVALIMGLRVTGTPVNLREDGPFSDLESEYGATVWNRKITIASIEARLDSLGDTVSDDFIRSFLLFMFGTILFPNANGKVNSRYLSCLQELDKVCHLAWGAAVLEDIIYWLCKRKEMSIQYVGGCLIFLQIWSYEHINIARPSLLECPMTFPRACRWGSSRSHQRQWFATKFKELEKNQIVWKLQLTSEESKMDTIKELLEAQNDREEHPEPRYDVLIDNPVDNLRTRLQLMDQWIGEMGNESEMDIVREVDVEQEDSYKVPRVQTENDDVFCMSHTALKVQGEHVEQPRTLEDFSSPIIISDEDDEDNIRSNDQILREQNVKLKKDIDELRKENQLLKDQLLSSSTYEKQNENLRQEVENLRQENQLLILSSNGLVSRLEKLLFDEDVSATEEQSSASIETIK